MNEKFYKILSFHLAKKKWKKYYPSIIFNLSALNKGYKPSFLWDIGPPLDVKILKAIIRNLKEELLLKSSVNLYLFENEIFFVNLETIYHYLCKYSNLIIFVNVSSNIREPVIIEENTKLYKAITNVLQLIKENVLSCLECMQRSGDFYKDSVDLKILCNCKYICPVTVFGILLGYPIVYWFDFTSSGNCLSFISLTVCKVRINNCLLPEIAKINNDCNILYSFSVPKYLNLDGYIDSWIILLKVLTNVEFQLCKEIVTLPCIQL